jgi:ATP-dependent DNA helicase HFM1/MER3
MKLACGVNLPARLVIIKSTEMYSNGEFVEYSSLDIMQMMGRAGRPQFDNMGVAIIMTKDEKKEKYENLICGEEIIESSLHQNLIEHFNAEIVLETITNTKSAIEWLKSTFLAIRLSKNPEYYKILNSRETRSVQQLLESLVSQTVDTLSKYKLIRAISGRLEKSNLGETMAKFYLKLNAMKEIVAMKLPASIKSIIETISRVKIFAEN